MNIPKILAVLSGVGLGIIIKDIVDIPKKSKQQVEDAIRRKSEFMERMDQIYKEEQTTDK